MQILKTSNHMTVMENNMTDTSRSLNTCTEPVSQVLERLQSSVHGLTQQEAAARLKKYGSNTLPRSELPSLTKIFIRQFASPLIYVLIAAAVVSIVIHEFSDAAFIGAVLLINAVIGMLQEFSAQKSADALQNLVTTKVRVLREGDAYEINSEDLVPGDIVLMESGDRVPADIRLINSHDLEIDESLLTGESQAVLKDAGALLTEDCVLGDRVNMAYAGTMVNRGRGSGVVVTTGLFTELGKIARSVLGKSSAKAPLQVRMDIFTHRVANLVGLAVLIMSAITFSRGMPLSEIFLSSVALAVSVIPEGLPVALTVALAIGMRRMAKRDVIVRQLVAVEALGSCTYIASDKTGTLTVNQLTARKLVFPGHKEMDVTGESERPEGEIIVQGGQPDPEDQTLIDALCLAAALANEGFLGRRNGEWSHHGDAVDVALLIMAHKAGFIKAELTNRYPEIDTIPFESERLFSASLNTVDNKPHVFVKGALEKVLPMCSHMMLPEEIVNLNRSLIEKQAEELACQGYRVIALASGQVSLAEDEIFFDQHLKNLKLIGLVGLIDPLRPEAKAAVEKCQTAGIKVAMVTGDHPSTALAIGLELGLAKTPDQVVTGPQLKRAEDQAEMDRLTRQAHVFARVEPQQKLDIVKSLQRNGHFVAVSGDGANDAPALRAAEVGVTMGKSGTDVARETAEIIITDDNFDSIVAGVEEGRIAYANVRKVIFLLISTGAAELVLFTLSLATGLPLPLLAVQLLWLNLVTNGIQDVALAFEPGECGELKQPPRSPEERIFNRLMIERVIISALVIGIVAFLLFKWLLDHGFSVDEARNGTLLLMVLFENVHVFNSRSETLSAFLHNPLRNPLLLFGTALAQLIHIGAMYTPWLGDVLGAQPVSFKNWLILLGLALSVLVVMELHKLIRKKLTGMTKKTRF